MPFGIIIGPTQSDIQQSLGDFLDKILPVDNLVLGAQDNLVPEPEMRNFVIMTPIRFQRLDTNLDTFQDSTFTATIADLELTVSDIGHGKIELGALLTGAGVPDDTLVVDGPADGGPGVYRINSSLTVADPQTFHAGAKILQINAQTTVQLDFHSEDYSAAQNAQTVALMFRDLYATDYFAALPAPRNRITPMHADQAALRPFVNDQNQYEWRWVVEATLQANQRIAVPQQFAQSINIGLVLVDLIDVQSGIALGAGPA